MVFRHIWEVYDTFGRFTSFGADSKRDWRLLRLSLLDLLTLTWRVDDAYLTDPCKSIALPAPVQIDQKNKNLAIWFWGGGFVAPFLATFYYFGFKFWEK